MKIIEAWKPYAQEIGRKYNILPSLILAQGLHESAMGTSGLAVKAKNLFGIKGKFNGQSVTMPTSEYVNNKWIKVDAAFRKYATWGDCFEDLCLLYVNGVSWDRKKYHKVVGEKDIQKACEAVQKAGYATDPTYAAKLLNYVNKYNLCQYDREDKDMKLTEGEQNLLKRMEKAGLIGENFKPSSKEQLQNFSVMDIGFKKLGLYK